MNLVQILYKTNTTFMNSENSKNSNPYRLVVVLTCKKILKNPEKMFCIIKPIISTIYGKIEKRHINNKN